MTNPRLYDIAREVTDDVFGKGAYEDINRDSPDPQVQAAIKRGKARELEASQRCGYAACWEALDENRRCRMPKGHEGRCHG
jgi:hypothetical protein